MHFSEEEFKYMTSLARYSVENYILKGKIIINFKFFSGFDNGNKEQIKKKLNVRLACFVTIKKGGKLRGCIGTVLPHSSLFNSIIENSISAATKDPRSPAVIGEELKDLHYDVTVLSEPSPVEYKTTTELFSQIRNRGVIIKKSFCSALYLPQVWEHFDSPGEFLSSLCRKAGLRKDEWKFLKLEIQIFEAIK